ncbi:head-tail adaptor protein [Gemmata sp. JC673]|uniref:Head-tail adaptor protein n=1 Tax=Gemmata algarum TaxID=2975278 RepID=A0ABU5EUK1_9BACT|nr:head-tail adaptor protein [Gemmata algarum]MDY3558120.1 head-tail adaptor protein [Gemmata algarum]
MARAGDYRDRVQWLQRVKGKDGFGDRRAGDTWTDAGALWAAIEDVIANREGVKESEKQKTSATVRLRNYPGVVAGDKLQDLDGNVWLVKTAVNGDNELTCDVER